MRKIIILIRSILDFVLPETQFGDKIYSYINFIFNHKGRFPKNQSLFNDYMYSLKTSSEIINPLRVFITDKEFGKFYIKSVVGDEYNVPTYKILSSKNEIDNYEFPDQCVIKPTHMSGKVILKKDTDKVDKNTIKSWLSMNFYNRSRERNYKDLIPKIIVEEMVFGESNLSDLKFFCFKGKAKLIQIDHDRYINHTLSLYDINWKRQNYSITFEQYKENIKKPENLESIIKVVNKLASNLELEFIRIDTYANNEKFYIGELTNLHGNAAEIFYPKSGELEASKIIFN